MNNEEIIKEIQRLRDAYYQASGNLYNKTRHLHPCQNISGKDHQGNYFIPEYGVFLESKLKYELFCMNNPTREEISTYVLGMRNAARND